MLNNKSTLNAITHFVPFFLVCFVFHERQMTIFFFFVLQCLASIPFEISRTILGLLHCSIGQHKTQSKHKYDISAIKWRLVVLHCKTTDLCILAVWHPRIRMDADSTPPIIFPWFFLCHFPSHFSVFVCFVLFF